MHRASWILLAVVALTARTHASPLTQTAGSDAPVDDPVSVPALDSQDEISIAYGGGLYLAAWHELRRAGSVESIRFVRLDASGAPMEAAMDLAPFSAPGPAEPSVAFDGSNFVVSWRDQLNGGGHLRYVSPAGMLLATDVPIAEERDEITVAAGGGFALAVYSANGGEVHATLVDATQNPAKVTSGIKIATGAGLEFHNPAASYGPAGFVVAYVMGPEGGDNTELYGARVTTGGSVTSLGKIAASGATGSSNRHRSPSIASSSSDSLVVWQDYRNGLGELYGAIVPATGAAMTDFAVHTGSTVFNPQVAWIGDRYVVAWEQGSADASTVAAVGVMNGAPVGNVVTIEATPAERPLLPYAFDARAMALASTGTSARLAWVYRTIGITASDVYTTPITLSGGDPARGTAAASALGTSDERSVASASNGSTFLVVWEDDRNLGSTAIDLYAQRFDQTGAALGQPFALTTGGGDERFPTVAALPDGDFLVAWTERGAGAGLSYFDIFGASTTSSLVRAGRVSATGTVKGTVAVGTTTTMANGHDRFPRVAVDPTDHRWLLTWQSDAGGVSTAPSIYMQAIDENGMIVGAGSWSTVDTNGAREPLCAPHPAWVGDKFLVVYERGCFNYGINPPGAQGSKVSDVLGVFVDKNAAPMGSTATTIAAEADVFETMPSVASVAGQTVVTWVERAKNGNLPDPKATLHLGTVGASGQVTSKQTIATDTSVPNASLFAAWPSVIPAGKGFLLTFVDQTTPPAALRALRISPNGAPVAADAGNANASQIDAVSAVAYGSPLVQPEPLAAALGVGAEGQVLVAYVGGEKAPASRVHTRLLQAKTQGDACNRAATPAGFGCADGRCERDAESADTTVGLCCATECSGPCQKCTLDGCVGVPAGDAECGTISCAALNTECRTYGLAPQACASFGRCGLSSDLSTCTAFTNVADGAPCKLPGCTATSSCVGGECVCLDAARDYGPPRTLPAGCSIAVGGAPTGVGGLVLFALVALVLARRRPLFLLVCALAGCADPNVLEINLDLDDGTLEETGRVRFVLATQGGFSAAAPSSPRPDELVRNIDLDGDGANEIVADLQDPMGATFPYRRGTTYLKIIPQAEGDQQVMVRVAVLNRFGNLIASAPPTAPTSIRGGHLDFALSCGTACGGTRTTALTGPILVDAGHAVSSIATGLGDQRLIAVGLAEAGGAQQPSRGVVAIYAVPDGAAAPMLLTRLDGEQAGDQLGTSVALGYVDGDDKLDLVIGAPGASGSAGRVYVVPGPLGAATTLASAMRIEGRPRDLFGASVATGGRGRFVAGAPGLDPAAGEPDTSAGAVYAFTNGMPMPMAGSSPGAHFGRAVAMRNDAVVAGAPGKNQVVLIQPSGTSTWTSTVPGLGAQVALADIDADGQPEIAAASPSTGAGILIVTPDKPALTDADVKTAVRLTKPGGMGAVLARVPTPFGDDLAAGTLGVEATKGAAFGLRGASIALAGSALPLALDGTLAALTATLAGTPLTAVAGADLVPGGDVEYVLGDAQGNLYFVAGGAP